MEGNAINYCEQCFRLVQPKFPNLYYEPHENAIVGELDISARYCQSDSGQWLIKPCDGHEKCLKCVYDIKICLGKPCNVQFPKVFELGGRIKRVMSKMNRHIYDMHLLEDGSCCLGQMDNKEMLLGPFINGLVFPFFVWQCYYETYQEIPPCGEHPHDRKRADMEYKKDIDALNPEDLCLCGSNKRSEECCKRG